MSVTVAAIMLDEAEYVARWAAGLRWVTEKLDAVVVLDGGSSDATVALLEEHTRSFACPVIIEERVFPGDFADQRNAAMAMCASPWVFMLDADETVSTGLLAGLGTVAHQLDRSRIDIAGVPRLNFIDDVLVASPGHRGLDYQYRLLRAYCRWEGRVHETPVGAHGRTELDLAQGHFIIHDKQSARHVARNLLYAAMENENT